MREDVAQTRPTLHRHGEIVPEHTFGLQDRERLAIRRRRFPAPVGDQVVREVEAALRCLGKRVEVTVLDAA